MRKWKGRIPGLVITLVMAVVVAAFIAVLTWTQFIPVHLLVPAGVALVMLATAAALLVRNTAFKVQFVLGTLLALILTAVLAVGGYYLYRTTSTLSRISETRTQSTPVAVYVRAEDAAQSISDTAGYSFGILSTLDRTNTDAGLSEIESALGAAVQTQEYAGITQLADGLLAGECDAIVLNLAYIDVLGETEGYTDFESKVHELEIMHVETETEEQSQAVVDTGRRSTRCTSAAAIRARACTRSAAATSTSLRRSTPKPGRSCWSRRRATTMSRFRFPTASPTS